MSTFGGLILTNRGRNLQSKAQAGITLQYTRIGVGDGHLGSTSILDLNNLVNEVMSLDITKLKVLGDGRAVIGTVLSNQNMTEGFYFREIGLFAEDPDLGEVLYCYGNAGELAEYISAGGGTDIIEKSIDIQTIVGNAENISAVINESLVYATKEDLENIEIPVTSVNNKTGDVKLTAEDVGAETPDGAQAKVNALAGEGNTKTVKDLDEEIAAHKADKVQHTSYAIATGTNSYVVNIDGVTSLVEGISIKVKFQNANTGTATLNINGLGAKEIRKSNGNSLSAGNIKAGQILHLVYTGSVFQLLGEGGEYGNVTPDDVIKGVTFGTEEGLKTGTLELTGNATASQVLTGRTFYTTNPKTILTGTMPNHGSKTFTPNDTTQTGSAGYYSGITVNPRPTLSGDATASQVLAGKTFYSNNYTKRTGTLVMPIPYTSVWTQRTSSFGTTFIRSVTYDNNMFVAGGGGGKLATSTNGITWTQRTSGFGVSTVNGITYGNNMFVAVGDGGKLATSTDGITWTQRTSGFGDSHIRGITYGNSMFVAVGNYGKLATSTDGITWTQRTSGFGDSHILGVTYGNNMFVAVGDDGKLATSTNGINWTQRTSGFGDYSSPSIKGVTYGNNMFVAVGVASDAGRLATSTDGITWILRTSGFGSYSINGVAYGINMFVAVGDYGKLATSSNGINWTQNVSSFDYGSSNNIHGVAYGVINGNSMFVAVGNSGKLATLS